MSKYFPNWFVDCTTVDEDGCQIYRKRENERTIKRNGIDLDNKYVVLHIHYLLLMHGAHVNVEWCNQSKSIKYLSKYVNKGHDYVVMTFYVDDDNVQNHVNVINMYSDCRYIPSCEAAWRSFSFDIHYRDPLVEQLNFSSS